MRIANWFVPILVLALMGCGGESRAVADTGMVPPAPVATMALVPGGN
jgi:hypothetical protein